MKYNIKKFIISLTFIFGLLLLTSSNLSIANAISPTPQVNKEVKLYKDVTLTLVTPVVQKAINEFYGKINNENPVVDPYHMDIVRTTRPSGENTYGFLIEIKATPYVGAHNIVGLDNITLQVAPYEVIVKDFKHIESYR